MNRPIPPTDLDARGRSILFALALLVIALLWFFNMDFRLLVEPDEGRYAEIPREMIASGDWLAPHLNDTQYLEKPPLQYWATAALYRWLGVSPWVSRLYNSGLAFLMVLLVWQAGRRLYGDSAGRMAALILASGVLFYSIAHVNTLDVGLTFWMNAAVLSLLAWNGSDARRPWLWLAWALLGLAVLQKGLVGVVLPGFALGLYIVLQRDWSLSRRLQPLAGLAVVAAINLPWWWLMQRRNPGFVDWFFVHEHYERFTTTEHGRAQPWWYFSALLLVGLMPWLVPTARGVIAGWRADAMPAQGEPPPSGGLARTRLLIVWAAATFLFYAPSGSKLAPYILPMTPPLALLAGRYLGLAAGPRAALGGSFLLASAMALALLALPTIGAGLSPSPDHVQEYATIARWGFGGGVLLGLAVLQAFARLKLSRDSLAARRERTVALLAIGVTGSLALLSNGTNAIETWRGAPQATEVLSRTLTADTQFFCVDAYPQTVIFALARTCTTVHDHGELEIQFDDGALNHLDTYDEFRAAWQAAPHAAAVIAPETWQLLQSQGLEARQLFATPSVVIASRP